jgi:hypothetical protein
MMRSAGVSYNIWRKRRDDSQKQGEYGYVWFWWTIKMEC